MLDKIGYLIVITLVSYVLKQLFSETPNFVKYKSKFLIFYLWASITAVVLLPFFVFNSKNVKNSLYGSQIVKHVTKVIEIKWHLRNGRVLAEDRGAVVVSNHQSSLTYLTKIWLFPEGTRNKDFTKLLPFKKGAFNIAVAAQVPIIPVVFSPYYFINRNKYIFNKGHVIIQCLEPVPTQGLTMEDVPDLIERVRNIMDAVYKELSKEVLSALPPNYPLATVDD
ncbi:hypothetical protein ACJJTC_010061 [Scirpophaga incertulas]